MKIWMDLREDDDDDDEEEALWQQDNKMLTYVPGRPALGSG